MKKEKSQMSIGAQTFLGKTVIGLLWIGVGITDMFDSLVMNIVHAVLLVGTIVVLVVVMRANREEDDEMSDYNYMKAKARTRDLMHFVYCGAAIVSALVFGLLQNVDIYWAQVISGMFFILMGVQDLITGIVFRRLEAE